MIYLGLSDAGTAWPKLEQDCTAYPITHSHASEKLCTAIYEEHGEKTFVIQHSFIPFFSKCGSPKFSVIIGHDSVSICCLCPTYCLTCFSCLLFFFLICHGPKHKCNKVFNLYTFIQLTEN